jgi:hypothetical protein
MTDAARAEAGASLSTAGSGGFSRIGPVAIVKAVGRAIRSVVSTDSEELAAPLVRILSGLLMQGYFVMVLLTLGFENACRRNLALLISNALRRSILYM